MDSTVFTVAHIVQAVVGMLRSEFAAELDLLSSQTSEDGSNQNENQKESAIAA